MTAERPILIVGGTGKTGRRVSERLSRKNIAVRIGSRSGSPAFDWQDPSTWPAALAGTRAAYITYFPDIAVPGATEAVTAFTDAALRAGVRRLVLLSGRGEEEAQAAEQALIFSGADWTIVRCAWFNQNFSESYLCDAILSGELALPVGDIGEPFVDADDIADVVAKVLSEDGHGGMIYELTGPRLLTFADAVREIAFASGRNVRFRQISHEAFKTEIESLGLPRDIGWLLDELFTKVLDGRNAHLNDGVQRALGRTPKDFSDYARRAAATGIWKAAA